MSKPLVLLCNPPSSLGNVADREGTYGMGAWLAAGMEARAPHTLAWSAAVLQKEGWHVRGLDATATGMDPASCIATIAVQHPALVVLLSSPTTAQADLDFVRALRQQLPTVRLLLVGLATRYLPHSMVQAADMVLIGEPEGAIDAACRHLLVQGSPVGECSPGTLNVAGYDGRGHLLDLKRLPIPAWDLFPVRRYAALPVMLARSCAYHCRYCAAPVTQGRVRRIRDAEQVVREMEELHWRFGVSHFHFWDPLFAAERVDAERLCGTLERSSVRRHITWSCETRPETLDLHLLQRMQRAGCSEIHLGVESVSPEALIAVGRLPDAHAVQSYLTKVREVVLGCRAFEIACHLHVMAGLPGNRNAASITRTFLRAYSFQAIHVSPLTPYPGTSIFPTNQVEKETAILNQAVAPDAPLPTEPFRLQDILRSKRHLSSI
ncbi:MAG: radical SAM protein [Chloroflexota bacterium]|nr:radical SAM protein [Chloroflexota bacterium]